MLVPYRQVVTNNSNTWLITDEERKRIAEFDENADRIYHQLNIFPARREPATVLDNFLFLGSRMHANTEGILRRFQIKHILNVCDLPEDPEIISNFNVIEIPISDDPEADIRKHFDRTNALLRHFNEKNERCLIHCAAGISRSATIVLAYLMKYHQKSLSEAHSYLVERRPQIRPNEGFFIQLMRYENDLMQSEGKEENGRET